jgi:arylsulfatase
VRTEGPARHRRAWAGLLCCALLAACGGTEEPILYDLLLWGDPAPARIESERAALLVPGGQRADFDLRLPVGAALTAERIEFLEGGALEVWIQPVGGEARRIETLSRSEREPRVPLPVGADRIVRLSLVSADSEIVLVHPAVRGPERPPPADRSLRAGLQPNLVIYLVDTLRADRLGCYGGPAGLSPNADAFASDATCFEQALAQSSWTRSSVASIFTGLWPIQHGVERRGDALPSPAATLAEQLRHAGYATAAFVTNGNVGRAFGFDQGFDHFELLTDSAEGLPHAGSDTVNDRVFAWLDGPEGEEPFFVYVHTMDPHEPYAPPRRFRAAFAGGAGTEEVLPDVRSALEDLRLRLSEEIAPDQLVPELGSTLWMNALAMGVIEPTPRMTRDLSLLYDAEVAYNDESFGALLDGLRARDRYDRSAVVFTSDHGEEFHEHGEWGHGRNLHDTSVRIPLIVRIPAELDAELDPTRLARHVDLMPTLLELAGLPVPDGVAGASLLAPEEPDAERGFSRLRLDERSADSVLEGPWKLVRKSSPLEDTDLFDLRDPRGEALDQWSADSIVAGYLENLLDSHQRSSGSILHRVRAEIDEELAGKLAALGYLESAPATAEWAGVVERGLYGTDPAEPGPRWTDGHAILVLPADPERPPQALAVELAWTGPLGTTLEIRANGSMLYRNAIPSGRWYRALDLRGIPIGGEARIELVSDTFVPRDELPGATDDRTLGVWVERVELIAPKL